jgi:DNA-binding transcriptional MocR family regulator
VGNGPFKVSSYDSQAQRMVFARVGVRVAAVEDPCDPGVRAAVGRAGLAVRPVAVDGAGAC